MVKKSIPHPSITGLASGALIAKYLNEGNSPGTTVIGAIMAGNIETAGKRFLDYAPALVTSKQGQKTLISSIAIASAGAFLRKALPNVKLGSTRLFARI
jgi:hypothetical protein